MQEPVSPIQITLPVRQLVEFLRRAGSIDNRFTGFDRANEGARIHRKLQRAAVKEHADYAAEVFLRGIFAYEEIEFTLEGRADGIFTAADGVTVVDEINCCACTINGSRQANRTLVNSLRFINDDWFYKLFFISWYCC